MTEKNLKPFRGWVRLTPAALEKLDRHARHAGASRSRLMREIIEGWLDERPDEPVGDPVKSGRFYDRSDYMREKMENRMTTS